MAYTPQTWVNEPATDTPISAARLTVMEAGIAAAVAPDTNGNLKADAFIPGFLSTAPSGTTITLTVDSPEVQVVAAGGVAQTLMLPTTGVVAGHQFQIININNNVTTVVSSGSNIVVQLSGSQHATLIALVNTPTTAAHWTFMMAPAIAVSSSVTNAAIAQRTGQGNIQANNFLPNITATTTSGGTLGLSNTAAHTQLLTGTNIHTVTLPTTSVAAGWAYKFINTSTGIVTINASGGALVKSLSPNTQSEITAVAATPTLPAHWFAT